MICGNELVTRGFELVTRGLELVTRGFELVTRGFELVTRGFELVTRGFELAVLNFNSCFQTFNSLLVTRISYFVFYHITILSSLFYFKLLILDEHANRHWKSLQYLSRCFQVTLAKHSFLKGPQRKCSYTALFCYS